MSKEIVICEKESLAAIVENGKVVEFYLSEGEQQVGDILLGRVESIVPAIEAAFINIGQDKNGFIHVADLPTSRARQAGIKQALKLKQSLLVQIAKEPTGTKGARLTSMLSIPGRYLVLTPFERRIGISKKITSETERGRLLRILSQIVQPGYGCVVRTEAVGQSEAALQEDLDQLLRTWQEILRMSEEIQAPALLYRDQDMLHRVLRESFTPDVRQVVVDTQDAYRRATDLVRTWGGGEAVRRVQRHRGNRPLSVQYNLYKEIEQAIQPRAPLPSGGYLIIEQTEALTVIDVNSGRLTSEAGLPETILKTNREAAVEVARQLRMRDIGGVIVVDFIDMSDPRDQQIVWQTLAEAVKPDKAQPQVSYFSDIGLIEMTRRRQRQSLLEQLSMDCPHCQGIGRVRNNNYRHDILNQAGAEARMALAEIIKDIVHEPQAIERPAGGPRVEEEPRYAEPFRRGGRRGGFEEEEGRRESFPAEREAVVTDFRQPEDEEGGREGRGRRRRRRRGGEREVAAEVAGTATWTPEADLAEPEAAFAPQPWEADEAIDLAGLDELAMQALAEFETADYVEEPAVVTEEPEVAVEAAEDFDVEPLPEIPDVTAEPEAAAEPPAEEAAEPVVAAEPEEEEEVTIKPTRRRRTRRPAAAVEEPVAEAPVAPEAPAEEAPVEEAPAEAPPAKPMTARARAAAAKRAAAAEAAAAEAEAAKAAEAAAAEAATAEEAEPEAEEAEAEPATVSAETGEEGEADEAKPARAKTATRRRVRSFSPRRK